MRHVYSKDEFEDKPQGQRLCRQWAKNDLNGFLKAKARLEAAFYGKRTTAEAERVATADQEEPYVPGEGDRRLDEMMAEEGRKVMAALDYLASLHRSNCFSTLSHSSE
jgi:hypothetical protein